MTLGRMRQVREVIWERQAERERAAIDIQERATRALMAMVAASAGNETGIGYAARWEMYPKSGEQEKELPNYGAVAQLLGGGGTVEMQGQFDWARIEAMAEQVRQGGKVDG